MGCYLYVQRIHESATYIMECHTYIPLTSQCSSLVLIPCAEVTTSLELITCTSSLPPPHMGGGDRSNQHSSHMDGHLASAHHLPALYIGSLLSINKSVIT